jgi:transposase
LKCDEGQHGPGWSDEAISEAFEVTVRTLENWRKQAVEYGPLSLLERKTQDRARFRKLDGAGEARLAQLACSDPPDGYGKWSLRLLADELVTLEIVDSIGHECVRQTLKKTSSSPGGKRCGASRPSKTQHS